jgi:hypothetical protein
MWRPDELVIDLACGARLTVRVVVDTANCRERDGLCPTADQIAARLWAEVYVAELEAPRT